MRPCCLATDDEWGIYSAGDCWWMGDLFCYSGCCVFVVLLLFGEGGAGGGILLSWSPWLIFFSWWPQKSTYLTQKGREGCTQWFIVFYHAVLSVFSFSVPKYLLHCPHVLEKNVISLGSTQIKRTVKLKRQTTSKHIWSNRWKRSR